ncbi:MAG: plasmid pRiA4b ORF-3 family protein [Mycobacteriaceae bacterium]
MPIHQPQDQPLEPPPGFEEMFGSIPDRPHLRRVPLPERRTYRIRLEIVDSDPPIWRELDVASDQTLSVLHQAIQASYLWWDYHLYRFALGASADSFNADAELFLCPFDVNEPDPYNDGAPASEVRLDETVQQPGDVLHYLYDFGDNWDLTVTLVEVKDREQDASAAVYLGGERAAPPEDCGSRRTAEELGEFADAFPDVLSDLEFIDVDEINQRLTTLEWWAKASSDPDYVPGLLRGYPVFQTVVACLEQSPWTVFLGSKLEVLHRERDDIAPEQKADALSGITHFLEIIADAGDKGVKLTASGYLPTAIVKQAWAALPASMDRHVRGNSESLVRQVLEVRRALTGFGLLRTYRGHVVLTAAGKKAVGDPQVLWRHLVKRMMTGDSSIEERKLDNEIGALVLLCIATTRMAYAEKTAIADLLSDSGWYLETDVGHRRLTEYEVNFESPHAVLLGFIAPLGERERLPGGIVSDPDHYGEAASALARDVLLAARGSEQL